MSDIAIRAEGLGKLYRIGGFAYQSFREFLAHKIYAPFRFLRDLVSTNASGNREKHKRDNFIWALKDVSFEIKQGEVIGIIGRNGAGKSTLLKILSRITDPTEGYAEIRGRVGSLLEVGVGFHPDLTGRENIYLNGAILGMKKKEIDRRLEEIVEFSGLQKFIDTPVKFYSSGMFVRLGFSVAAHLDTEILLVDEVLAVGDVEFQKKCLGKMSSVSKSGRTVLFVSHNLGAIKSLTQRCIYLHEGRIISFDDTKNVTERYLKENVEHRTTKSSLEFYRYSGTKNSPVRITEIYVNSSKEGIPTLQMGEDITIYIQMEAFREIRGAVVTIFLKNSNQERVSLIFSEDKNFYLNLLPGKNMVSLRIKNVHLAPGQYFADFHINQTVYSLAYDLILDFPIFRIDEGGKISRWNNRPWGVVHFEDVIWSQENHEEHLDKHIENAKWK